MTSIRVRAIEPHELHTFTQTAASRANPERHAQLTAHLAERWAAGMSRPSWCFVAEEDGAIVGRVGYWTRPRVHPTVRYINPLLLDLPWHGDYRRIGSLLLRESLDALHRDGATNADLGADCPTDFDPSAARCVDEVLTATGWERTRETLRFDLHPAESPDPNASGTEQRRLTFRPIDELGDDTFVDAVSRAIVGTLNVGMGRDIERHGAEHKARSVLAGARALVRDGGWRVDPGWWQVGYTPDGALAGFVMPVINASGDGIIWNIGVVPEQRGRRYVDDLLARLAEVLFHAGAPRIVADTDTPNWPMANAFARTGWRQFATSTTYVVDLVRRSAIGPSATTSAYARGR